MFTDTEHCSSEKHCKTCRRIERGLLWRKAIIKKFGGDDEFFPCPLGKPWGKTYSEEYGEPVFVASLENNYDDCIKDIELSKNEGVWQGLKDLVRMTEEQIKLHHNNTPCWKRKQRQRIMTSWQTVRRKEGYSGAISAKLNFNYTGG